MKDEIEKVIKEVKTTLSNTINNRNGVQLQLALDLRWARHVINWRLTSYKGWIAFCTQELSVLSMGTITKYLTITNKMHRFKYSKSDAEQIVNAIGWRRFALGLALLKRRVAVKTFIKRYKNLNYITGWDEKANDSAAFTFSLPAEYAEKFSGYLRIFGMMNNDKRRANVRVAMMGFLDSLD